MSGLTFKIQSSLSYIPFLSSSLDNKLTASKHAVYITSCFELDYATFCQLSNASSFLLNAAKSLGFRAGTSTIFGFFLILYSNSGKYLWQFKTGFARRNYSSLTKAPVSKNHLTSVKSII